MKTYVPYNIVHLQLKEACTSQAPGAPAMIVLWGKDIPLGHIWLDAPMPPGAYKERIAQTVSPAIHHYLPGTLPQWQNAIVNGDSTVLTELLNSLATKQVLSTNIDIHTPVSVVICTRNRAQMLDRCLASLATTPGTFEVIVVDNAPDDNTTKKVAASYPFCTYVLEPHKGLDIARNTGARAAQYDIIAYTDDDVQLPIGWVAKIRQCFTDPRTMAVTGQVFPLSLQTRSQYVFERYWGFNKGYSPTVFDHKYFLDHLPWGVPVWDIGAGANMAFRKDVFNVVGWFDDRLDVGAAGCSGDSEFWYRILAEGWNCFYNPQLYVYHQHRDTKQALDNQVFHYMRGQVASLYVQHERYGHEGNLLRINKILPQYYAKRLLKSLAGRLEEGRTLLTEIRGYLSGRRYYSKNSRPPVAIAQPLPSSLSKPAIINNDTLVSIVITCYNYGHYLARAISSCLAQSHSNIQVIVVDDGSTDNTEDVARSFPGIVYTCTYRVGLSAARNIGIRFAEGDYVLFLDADDYLYPNAVELGLYYFSYYPMSAFVSGGHDKLDNDGKIIPEPEQAVRFSDCYQALLQGNYIGMEATVLYRRDLFCAFHFNTSLKVCEDYDINLRISRQLPAFSHNTKVAAYCMHGGNMSKNQEQMLRTAISILNSFRSNDTSENQFIDQGIKNWEKYYLQS